MASALAHRLRRVTVRIPWFLYVASWAVACGQPALSLPPPVTITIAGSTSMAPVLHALTAEFNRRHPNVVFSLRGGASTLGEEWVAAGQIDLAATTLQTEGAETESGPGDLVRIPIGLDGVAVIVHDSNQVPQLTLIQLRDLYSGRILNWSDVAGPSDEVLLVSREDGSGIRRFFEERVMGGERVALTAIVMPTSQDVLEYVGEHGNAVGYLSASYLTRGERAGEVEEGSANRVRAVPVEGVFPSGDTLLSRSYHLVFPIYLASRGESRGWVRQFVDFVLSPAGQAIVGRYHGRVR